VNEEFGMNVKINCQETILSSEDIKRYKAANQSNLSEIDQGLYSDNMLGWMDVNEWSGEADCSQIVSIAEEIRENAEVFVVVGLGGSNQGARAVIDALGCGGTGNGRIEIMYAAINISPNYMKKLIENIGNRSVYFNIIAKNFQTIEPGIAFRIICKYMEERYGEKEAAKRFIITPTLYDGALHKIALENGYRFLPFPDNVGGRYSVFTPVGLLPIAVAGIDINKLLDGARNAQKDYQEGGPIACYAKEYALWRNQLLQKGYSIEVLAFFEPELEMLGKWWRQLFGESEGKNNNGIFPAVCSYTEDLHSMGQYMQEGKRQVLETFIHVEEHGSDLVIESEVKFNDGFEYLDGKGMNEINECAYQATVKAHYDGGVPCSIIELPRLDEYNLGQLMYFFFLSCFYSSVLLGVNPFDQPGVEQYKAEMLKLLHGER
jgi:glucose-6-phosphate isomerase